MRGQFSPYYLHPLLLKCYLYRQTAWFSGFLDFLELMLWGGGTTQKGKIVKFFHRFKHFSFGDTCRICSI